MSSVRVDERVEPEGASMRLSFMLVSLKKSKSGR